MMQNCCSSCSNSVTLNQFVQKSLWFPTSKRLKITGTFSDLFFFYLLFTVILCIPRWPLPLHGDGIHAWWGPCEFNEQLWCSGEMGKILYCWSCTCIRCNSLNGFYTQVKKKKVLLHSVVLFLVLPELLQ